MNAATSFETRNKRLPSSAVPRQKKNDGSFFLKYNISYSVISTLVETTFIDSHVALD